jgi:hypothetical protein
MIGRIIENFRPDAAEILTRGSRRRSRMILNKRATAERVSRFGDAPALTAALR